MQKESRDAKKIDDSEETRSDQRQDVARVADSPDRLAEETEINKLNPEEELSIEELKAENERLYDRWLRQQADFENYRRRSRSEKEEALRSGQVEVIKDLLLVIDACENGLESMDAGSDDPVLISYRQGYELLLKQLRSLLDRYEVYEVSGVGSLFDPNVHEAIIREETEEYRDGEIIEEYRKGYLMKDRLLRPSQVKVAAHTLN